MTDTWLAEWAIHCTPCGVFAYVTSSGMQWVFMPFLHEPCDECGLTH